MNQNHSVKHIIRQGCFDLQGYHPKSSKLPTLNLKNIRSVTPDFLAQASDSQRGLQSFLHQFIPSQTPQLIKNPVSQLKDSKIQMPNDIISLKLLIAANSDPFVGQIGEEKATTSASRNQLIMMEKWLNDMLGKYSNECEVIYTACMMEVLKDVFLQCSNRGRLIWKLFEGMKLYWEKETKKYEEKVNTRENKIIIELKEIVKKLENDVYFFKSGMDDYLNKYMVSDEKVILLQKEVGILRQIIQRFTLEYHIHPIDFNKVCELVIEDISDGSKRSQQKIINSVLPKSRKAKAVQTDEILIVKTSNKQIQATVHMRNTSATTELAMFEASTQTNFRKLRHKQFYICKQSDLPILNRYKARAEGKKSRGKIHISFLDDEERLTNEQNLLMDNRDNESSLPFLKSTGFDDSPNRYNDTIGSNGLDSRAYSACSCKSSSIDSIDLMLAEGQKSSRTPIKNHVRAFTPGPHKKNRYSHHRKPVFQKLLSPALEVLNECIKTSSKKLANESSLSIRTLLKTIDSMFLSSIPSIRNRSFKSFLQHVFLKLSNKYSLKKMREKRLRDLISSSVKYKDLQMPKLFLRVIGAGKCVGLSNYSYHTFKIMLQIINYINSHTTGPNVIEINGRKMCPKNKALDCAKEIFTKRLDSGDLVRLLSYIETHSKSDSYGLQKEGIVDYEWLLNYMVYTFDYYEKQILTGLSIALDAITYNKLAICISKGEFFLAFKTFHSIADKTLEDPLLIKIYPFLSPSVQMTALISVSVAEKIALFRGLFKPKYIDRFRKNWVKSINEAHIDRLNYLVSNIGNKWLHEITKEFWQKKIQFIKSSKDVELSFAIFSMEIERIMGLIKNNTNT